MAVKDFPLKYANLVDFCIWEMSLDTTPVSR